MGKCASALRKHIADKHMRKSVISLKETIARCEATEKQIELEITESEKRHQLATKTLYWAMSTAGTTPHLGEVVPLDVLHLRIAEAEKCKHSLTKRLQRTNNLTHAVRTQLQSVLDASTNSEIVQVLKNIATCNSVVKSCSMESADIEALIDELDENREETEETSIALQMCEQESSSLHDDPLTCHAHDTIDQESDTEKTSLVFPTIARQRAVTSYSVQADGLHV